MSDRGADDDQPMSCADPTEEEVMPKRTGPRILKVGTLGSALKLRDQEGMSLEEKIHLMKCEGEEPQFTDAEFKVCWDKMRQVVKSSPEPMRKYWAEMQHDQQKGKNKIKRAVLLSVMKNDWNFDRSVMEEVSIWKAQDDICDNESWISFGRLKMLEAQLYIGIL